MAILLVDSYDSFTFNLKNLIEISTGTKVYTIHNDTFTQDEYHQLDLFVSNFDAIIIGPGPGDPRSASDVGCIPYLLTKTDTPILGICLGFQCLCLEYGATIAYLSHVKHGQVYKVKAINDDPLFNGMKEFNSVRYHSIYLTVDAENDQIVPLAVTKENDGEVILMASKHKWYPHYGVQYHPESICSEDGDILIKNFWSLAKSFNKGKVTHTTDLDHDLHIVKPVPLFKNLPSTYKKVHVKEIQIESANVDICNYLETKGEDFLLLNSAAAPGQWSIIGLPIEGDSDVITHSTQDPQNVVLSKWKTLKESIVSKLSSDIWSYIAEYMETRQIDTDGIASTFPFIGGLIGFISYEEGQFINLDSLEDITKENIPDIKLCFIERMILHDLQNDKHYLCSIRDNDELWLELMDLKLPNIGNTSKTFETLQDMLHNDEKVDVVTPEKDTFTNQFSQCQDYLNKGESYELCLTTMTTLKVPKRLSSWEIYKTLTKKNPSPYSCYMKFDNCQLISSSPERFLSWNNESCQLRPIKGTVKNSPEMTLSKLTEILKTPKEMGENLMIVDLIRHDLHNFLDQVDVVQLMKVEEYKTVYQLVSVINGKFNPESPYKGLDILSKSLPPGSMTGAPKKRSVELLQSIELNKRRGIYSGVCGYYSVNNKSDWSVVIRSCFQYQDDILADSVNDIWRIGAGGAITVLSDVIGEWEEMELKLQSALQAFIG